MTLNSTMPAAGNPRSAPPVIESPPLDHLDSKTFFCKMPLAGWATGRRSLRVGGALYARSDGRLPIRVADGQGAVGVEEVQAAGIHAKFDRLPWADAGPRLRT
jgi:hypothetical protein